MYTLRKITMVSVLVKLTDNTSKPYFPSYYWCMTQHKSFCQQGNNKNKSLTLYV